MSQNGTLLLTGGSGMVGRNILEHPRARDWTILSPSSRELDLTEVRGASAHAFRSNSVRWTRGEGEGGRLGRGRGGGGRLG